MKVRQTLSGDQAGPESVPGSESFTGSNTFFESGETEKTELKNLVLKQKTTEEFQTERREEAGMLNQFRNEMSFNPIYSKVSSEIKLNITDQENPLNWNPGLHLNTDLYLETVKYARQKQPELLAFILGAETDYSRSLSADDIGRFGSLISSMTSNSQIQPQHCLALQKVKTITSKSNGLNDDGLDLLCSARVTQSSRTAYRMREEHANLALEMSEVYGKQGAETTTLDNLAISKGGKLVHYTQVKLPSICSVFLQLYQ